MSNVIHLPVQQKVCSDCKHFMCGVSGMYCAFWREDILFEDNAEDCEAFEQ